MGLNATARGSGYYFVYVNGVFFSKHLQEREALERCADVLLTDPTVQTHYTHQYEVDVALDSDQVALPPPSDPPVSDSGYDIVDFLARLDEQSNGPLIVGTVLQAPDFWSGIQELTLRHRDEGSWLFQRLAVLDDNGEPERVGLSWRGYVLLWHLRDKNAIRIGGMP